MKQKNSGFVAIGIVIVLLVIAGASFYFGNQKISSPTNTNTQESVATTANETKSGCEKIVILQNRKDGVSIPQKVTLGGKDYSIDSHIESEDNWASFSINGDIGPKGKYYNPLAPNVGNPLAIKSGGSPFPDSIVIQGVSIKLTKVGYTTQSRQEFAEVCLNS